METIAQSLSIRWLMALFDKIQNTEWYGQILYLVSKLHVGNFVIIGYGISDNQKGSFELLF